MTSREHVSAVAVAAPVHTGRVLVPCASSATLGNSTERVNGRLELERRFGYLLTGVYFAQQYSRETATRHVRAATHRRTHTPGAWQPPHPAQTQSSCAWQRSAAMCWGSTVVRRRWMDALARFCEQYSLCARSWVRSEAASAGGVPFEPHSRSLTAVQHRQRLQDLLAHRVEAVSSRLARSSARDLRTPPPGYRM